MSGTMTKRILSVTGLVALVAVGQTAQAENNAFRLAAGVPTGQAILLSEGQVAVAAPGQGRILLIDSMGNARVIGGNGQRGFSGDGGAATSARFSGTSSLAADNAGNLYLADTGNNRIRRIDARGIVTTVAGTGDLGFDGDGGPALLASFDSPSGLAVDAQGNLYDSDTGNHRIRRVDTHGVVTTIAGTGEAGFDGDGVLASTARLNTPTGLAYDAARGRLIVADTGNHVVRSLEADGTLRTLAGSGRPGLLGDQGPATDARLTLPTGVGVDLDGNLYIADTGNHRVRMVNTMGTMWSIDETMETPLRLSANLLTQPARRIVFSSPNPGDAWRVGSVHVITWQHNLCGNGPFIVELSRNGGLTWESLATVSGRAFVWRVSSGSTSSAMIRVRNGAGVFGVSSTFTIWMAE
jgi:sugar lactone lactonase YvrE